MIKLEYIIAIMLIGGAVLKSIIFCYYAYKISEKSIKNKSSSYMILIKPTSSNLNSHQVLLKQIGKLHQELIMMDKYSKNYTLDISQNKADYDIVEKELYKSNNGKKNTQYCQFCGTIRKEIDHFCRYCSIEKNFED